MKIAVIGSVNTDIVYHVDRTPNKGETVFGSSYELLPGGKGANQAVALRAMTQDVHFFGAVGNGIFGDLVRKNLSLRHVSHNLVTKPVGSGVAIIELKDGDNRISVIKGANDLVNRKDVDGFLRQHEEIDLIVCQGELHVNTIHYIIFRAHQMKIKLILNPAPAFEIREDEMQKISYLIPNEKEAEVIFHSKDLVSIVKRYPNKVIITKGKQGAMYHDGKNLKQIPAREIIPVDTTGAGDSFVAGFSYAIHNNASLEQAVRTGIEAGTITCQYLGAQGAYFALQEAFDSRFKK
ncbi:MAG: ribokinase [Bacilli bacterium]|nr:ribokinase [Bacilli bacterium]